MKKIYTDNASTSYPKAPGVSSAIKEYLDLGAYNINRGGYTGSYNIAMEVLEARQLVADLFSAASPKEVVFTPGTTYSLNMLLVGLLKPGDHVITTSMEHNAVTRPLHALEKLGVTYNAVPCGTDGSMEGANIIPYIRKETKAVVISHASNVCGTVMPLEAIAEICRQHNIRLIVDAAQTAGILDIDASLADAVAFAGHKGLLGPQGIGGFVIKDDFAEEISPLIFGGTGSFSHGFEQPQILPDKFEAGTINIPGILGLKKAVEYVSAVGTNAIHEKEMALTAAFLSKLEGLTGVKIIGKNNIKGRVAVVSLDFESHDNAAIAAALDEDYGIMTRCGLHCAPIAHKTLGTYPHGTVRFSFGWDSTLDDVECIFEALRDLTKK